MTTLLGPDALSQAAKILQRGGLLAFPTETVYGLGADATNGRAVAAIYEAKGRPSFNPLIVHVPDLNAAQGLAQFDPVAIRLAEAFWPGPLTLVVPLKDGSPVSDLVTAGLDTVAIRVPATELAQSLVREAGVPVAAPSANPSGRISPTTAEHVQEGLDGRIDAILDGGACTVGVESTIVATQPARLLRPGGISVEALETCLGEPLLRELSDETISAPGQLASHYAPNAALRLNATTADPGELLIGFGDISGDLVLSPAGDLREAAARLFALLREADTRSDRIAVAPIPDSGLGLAINDRLRRAAAPRS